MKRYFYTFAPFALAVLLGSLTFAFAQETNQTGGKPFDGGFGGRPPRGDGGAPGIGWHPRLLEQLNLTDAQKEQITTIHAASREAGKANFDKVRAFDDQLKTLVESGSFDEAAARKILTAKAELMIENDIARLRSDAAILKVLTAEQKTRLEQLKQQRPEPPMGGRGGFRPPPLPTQN